MRAFHIAGLVRVCVLLAAAGPSAGCIVDTEHPLYDRHRDAVFDGRLVGLWYAEGYDLRIGRDTAAGYTLRTIHSGRFNVGSDDQPLTFDLTRVEDRLYGFFTEAGDTSGRTLLTGACQVTVDANEFRVRMLNLETLGRRLANDPPPLAFKPNNRGLLAANPAPAPASGPATRRAEVPTSFTLTDPPAKIRQYLIDHRDDPELFGSPILATRWLPVAAPRSTPDAR